MMQARDYHMTADTAQPRKRSNVTRPFPDLSGVWARVYSVLNNVSALTMTFIVGLCHNKNEDRWLQRKYYFYGTSILNSIHSSLRNIVILGRNDIINQLRGAIIALQSAHDRALNSRVLRKTDMGTQHNRKNV